LEVTKITVISKSVFERLARIKGLGSSTGRKV
jgi:hypothetical protein